MTLVKNKKFNLLFYYQSALAVIAIFTFYTNLDLYLSDAGILPFSSVIPIVIFSLATTPLLFSVASRIKYIPKSLIIWCLEYLTISIISFLLFPSDEFQYRELRLRFLSVLIIFTTVLVFSKYSIIQLLARRAIFVALIVNIFNVFYSLFNPTAFKVDLWTDSLRPSGFYMDANKGGYALVIGMIFSIGLLKPKYRIYLLLLVGLAVLLTFSRGAILAWLTISIITFNLWRIPKKNLLPTVIGIVVVAAFLLLLAGSVLEDLTSLQANDLNYREMLNRLNWFQDSSDLMNDNSSDERFELAMMGWQLFADSPLIGNGIASTLQLGAFGKSTHNMYLFFMADHGILGAFIMPTLAFAMTQNACRETKLIGRCCMILLLLWCLFSHTVLEDKCTLIMVSLIAAMTTTSQLETKYQVGHKP